MLETILITIVLIAAFAGVAWYGYKSSLKSKSTNHHDEQRIEPSLADEAPSLNNNDNQEQQALYIYDDDVELIVKTPENIDVADVEIIDDLPTKLEPATDQVETITEEETAPTPVWDKVIAFTVMAQEGQVFSGKAVKAMLDKLDFHFGDMQLYHRKLADMEHDITITVANILDPGTLDPANFIAMKTPGLLVFIHLEGDIDGVSYFDALTVTTQAIADRLKGVLSDESRRALSADRVDTLRKQIVKQQAEISQ